MSTCCPNYLTRRFISAEAGRGRRLRPHARHRRQPAPADRRRSSTKRSTRCAQKHPGYTIAVTGLSAIAARNSANMIDKLNRGADRSRSSSSPPSSASPSARSIVMLASILPGIFPIVLSGTLLWLLGRGPAIRQRRRADRLVRPRPERDDPLPQPPAARRHARRRSRRWRSSARRCWSGRR